MTTNTPADTASQAEAVTIDTPEFRQRLRGLRNITMQETMDIELNEICDDIDAKLAQAREEGRQAGLKHAVRTIENSNDTALESLKQRDEWKARATAAEAQLSAIRAGIANLPTMNMQEMPQFGEYIVGMRLCQDGLYMLASDVRALLIPQGQASETDGLPS